MRRYEVELKDNDRGMSLVRLHVFAEDHARAQSRGKARAASLRPNPNKPWELRMHDFEVVKATYIRPTYYVGGEKFIAAMEAKGYKTVSTPCPDEECDINIVTLAMHYGEGDGTCGNHNAEEN